MRKLEDYIRMFRPTDDDKAIFLYGSKYKLWLLGTYIGTARWVRDDHLGDTSQNHVTVNGELLQVIYVADTYELMIETRKQKASN